MTLKLSHPPGISFDEHLEEENTPIIDYDDEAPPTHDAKLQHPVAIEPLNEMNLSIYHEQLALLLLLEEAIADTLRSRH